MDDVLVTAKQLVERYGDIAASIALDRAKKFEAAGDWPAHSIALKVLTEVERQQDMTK